MTIRKPKPEDRLPLLDLCIQFHKKYDKEEVLSVDSLPFSEHKDLDNDLKTDLEDLFDEKKFIVFVAEESEVLVGFIAGKINEKPEKILDREGYIDDWFVTADYRGKGVGKLLYDALVDEFRSRGCTHLALDVFAENTKAIDYYHKLGFKDYTIVMKKKEVS